MADNNAAQQQQQQQQQHKHHHHHHTDAEKEKKRKKALRRMSKILTKAWELSQAEPFQSRGKPSSSLILCLTSLGLKVDEEKYGYGRHGWEEFAKDIGGIYNRHLQRYVVSSMCSFRFLEKLSEDYEMGFSLASVSFAAAVTKIMDPVVSFC
jgi:hypothetical protein